MTSIFKLDRQPIYMKLAYLLTCPAWYFGMRTLEEGGRCSVYCAVAPIGDHKSEWGGEFLPGAYHANMKPVAPLDKYKQSADEETMRKLYEYSVEALKLTPLLPEDYRKLNGTE